MTKILISILLTLTTQTVWALDMSEDDKQKHYVASASIAAPIYVVMREQNGWKRWQASLLALGVTLFVGHMKETYDPTYDMEDMGANALGAGTGIMLPIVFNF
jgi:hypothetical protein